MRTVRATVVYPQSFTIEVDDDNDTAEDQIIEHAAYLMETSPANLVITDCDIEELID